MIKKTFYNMWKKLDLIYYVQLIVKLLICRLIYFYIEWRIMVNITEYPILLIRIKNNNN